MAQRGFTLIEIIVGIVAFGIAAITLTVLVFPQAPKTAEPILQTRASALASMFMEEIMAKGFDEQSDLSGSYTRCGDPGAANCTAPSGFGSDGETRAQYDDVDDFDGLASPTPISDILSSVPAGRFSSYQYEINVTYADASGQSVATISDFKRIDVTITVPTSQRFIFNSLRGNY